MFTAPGAYDRVITIFSPEGRLYQVEYAVEAVKRGASIVGLACKSCSILAAEERPPSRLLDDNFTWKIFQIDDHVGVAIAGFGPDARVLVDQARIYAQSNRLMYDEPIDIEVLAKRIADIKQLYTQHAGVRPFGVAMLFGGVDRYGARLFATLPGGDYWSYKAAALGMGSEAAIEFFEENYKPDLTVEEAIVTTLRAIVRASGGKDGGKRFKVAVIPVETKRFRVLPDEEVAKYLENV